MRNSIWSCPTFRGTLQPLATNHKRSKPIPVVDASGTELLVPGLLIESPFLGEHEGVQIRVGSTNVISTNDFVRRIQKLYMLEQFHFYELLEQDELPDDAAGTTAWQYSFPIAYEAELKSNFGDANVRRVKMRTRIAGMRIFSGHGVAYMDVETKATLQGWVRKELEDAARSLQTAKTDEQKSAATATIADAEITLSDLQLVITEPSSIEERRKWSLASAMRDAIAAKAQPKPPSSNGPAR